MTVQNKVKKNEKAPNSGLFFYLQWNELLK